MRKYFPFVIAVASISLLAIIYIQLKWLKLSLAKHEEQLNNTMTKVVREVGHDIVNKMVKKYNSIQQTLKKNNIYNGGDILFQESILSAENVISAQEVSSHINALLKIYELKDLKYDFAIVRNNNPIIASFAKKTDFEKIFLKTTKNKIYNLPLNYLPDVPFFNVDKNNIEVLYIVLPNFKGMILQELSWSIGLMLIFLCAVVLMFYLTVSFTLKQEKIDVIKSNFINNMTHEFKTPIATIAISSNLLKNQNIQQDPQQLDYYVDVIKRENMRMLDLVETILKNAVIAKGELKLEKQLLNIHEILNNLVQKYQVILESKNGAINIFYGSVVDNIIGDDTHIVNAFSNIIDNAIKYSKPDVAPEIVINTTKKNNFIFIAIKDNGIGIPKKEQSKIFDTFYRINTGDKHNVKGFGLGLSYAHSIFMMHGGAVTLKSQPNQGTQFIIKLPLVD